MIKLYTTATTFLLFSHHHHHRHHISIVFPPPPPPPPPHFYCFPSTTTATFLLFSLHHHSIFSDQLTISRMFISQTTYSEGSIYKSRNCNLKLKSSFKKVKRIIPQKNHSTSTRSPVQTQEAVYELSRSRKNGVSFKEKAKRTTTKNKTNRKKQKKSNSWLRGYRKIVQTRKDYLLFLVIERRKPICNSQSKD